MHTLSYLLSEQEIFFVYYIKKEFRVEQKFCLVHEKKIRVGQKIQNSSLDRYYRVFMWFHQVTNSRFHGQLAQKILNELYRCPYFGNKFEKFWEIQGRFMAICWKCCSGICYQCYYLILIVMTLIMQMVSIWNDN